MDYKYSKIMQKLSEILNFILDLKIVNQNTFLDQEKKIRELRRRKSILATKNYDYSPIVDDYDEYDNYG
ncbi:MAG: hypothetical protein ACJ0DD_05000 [Paracoccaceae bacterium]